MWSKGYEESRDPWYWKSIWSYGNDSLLGTTRAATHSLVLMHWAGQASPQKEAEKSKLEPETSSWSTILVDMSPPPMAHSK